MEGQSLRAPVGQACCSSQLQEASTSSLCLFVYLSVCLSVLTHLHLHTLSVSKVWMRRSGCVCWRDYTALFSVHPQLPPIDFRQHRPHCCVCFATSFHQSRITWCRLTGRGHGELLPFGSDNRLEWLCGHSEILLHEHWKHLLLICFCLCLTVSPNTTHKQRLVCSF